LYISHFLEEVLRLTDRVTVLRDGQVVAEMETATLSEEQLIEAMVGKKLLSSGRCRPDSASEARAGACYDHFTYCGPSIEIPVDFLSGGNAQKVVPAKWMYGPVKVFLLEEPTVGVDVGAKGEILKLSGGRSGSDASRGGAGDCRAR
jgi:ABC-type sugar transport system ATPase subunit